MSKLLACTVYSPGCDALLIRLAAEGNKLFLWREVWVVMGRSLLPEGKGSKSLWQFRTEEMSKEAILKRSPEATEEREINTLNDYFFLIKETIRLLFTTVRLTSSLEVDSSGCLATSKSRQDSLGSHSTRPQSGT